MGFLVGLLVFFIIFGSLFKIHLEDEGKEKEAENIRGLFALGIGIVIIVMIILGVIYAL